MRSILNAALESPHFALAKRLVLLVECHHAKDSIRPYLSNGWQGKLSAKYAQAEKGVRTIISFVYSLHHPSYPLSDDEGISRCANTHNGGLEFCRLCLSERNRPTMPRSFLCKGSQKERIQPYIFSSACMF
jgi:hypothetical protein